MTSGNRNTRLAVLLCIVALAVGAIGSALADESVYASHGMPEATPSEVYLRYVEIVGDADSVEDILPFSPFPIAKNQKDLEAMPLEQRKKALGFIKGMMSLADAQVLSEQVDGDTATLEVRGQSPGLLSGELEPTWGTITLVRKAGEWKVSNQAFRETEQAAGDS